MQLDFHLSMNPPPQFDAAVTQCVVYVEADNRILTIPQNRDTWNLPVGNLKKRETPINAALRIFNEHTKSNVSDTKYLQDYGTRYVQNNGRNAVVHFYGLKYKDIPSHLAAHTWVSIFAYRYLHLIHANEVDLNQLPPEDGRLEMFDVVYHDKVWRQLPVAGNGSLNALPVHQAATLVLLKGDHRLEFNHQRRLIISLLGIASCGKKTQSQLIGQALGVPSASIRDIFQSMDTNSRDLVGLYAQHFSGKQMPDVLPDGMVAKWLSDPARQAGAVLRGYPVTEGQCKVMTGLLSRATDLFISFYLNVTDDISDRVPMGEARTAAESRNGLFQQHIGDVVQLLHPQTLDLAQIDSVAEVFHQIFSRLQTALDQTYARETQARARVQPQQLNGVAVRQERLDERSLGEAHRQPNERDRLLGDQGVADEGKCCVVQ